VLFDAAKELGSGQAHPLEGDVLWLEDLLGDAVHLDLGAAPQGVTQLASVSKPRRVGFEAPRAARVCAANHQPAIKRRLVHAAPARPV
jgi:hypothetical protein